MSADWSREMRNQKLIDAVPLRDWVILFTQRDMRQAQDFLQSLSRVAPGMGLPVSPPEM